MLAPAACSGLLCDPQMPRQESSRGRGGTIERQRGSGSPPCPYGVVSVGPPGTSCRAPTAYSTSGLAHNDSCDFVYVRWETKSHSMRVAVVVGADCAALKSPDSICDFTLNGLETFSELPVQPKTPPRPATDIHMRDLSFPATCFVWSWACLLRSFARHYRLRTSKATPPDLSGRSP